MHQQIRRAVAADARDLAELAAETFPMASPPGTPLEELADFIAKNLSEIRFREYVKETGTVVLVYEADGELLGYALVQTGPGARPEPDFGVRHDPSAFLSKLYVRQRSQGGSVAGPLMEAVKEVARDELACESVWLAVNQQNHRAARFYDKHGFDRVGVKQMHVGSLVFSDFVYEFGL